MTTRFIEIMVGLFVVLGFLALFMLAMKVSNLSRLTNNDGYEVTAYFENIGGLKSAVAGDCFGCAGWTNYGNCIRRESLRSKSRYAHSI